MCYTSYERRQTSYYYLCGPELRGTKYRTVVDIEICPLRVVGSRHIFFLVCFSCFRSLRRLTFLKHFNPLKFWAKTDRFCKIQKSENKAKKEQFWPYAMVQIFRKKCVVSICSEN
uniref:Uncharacterized protein n=1 Tax=Cacopsylla melanoneura TaxID=428564 RepID=A0A8D8WFY6_9HEMI